MSAPSEGGAGGPTPAAPPSRQEAIDRLFGRRPTRRRRRGRCPVCDRLVDVRVNGRIGSHLLKGADPCCSAAHYCVGIDAEPVIGSVRFTEGGEA